ncbi:MAG: serine--tRNA ligase [Kiritimatiellae bacterium]|nr:serine--tRNA ligase [Kiritimatiellia bacterium]
MLDLKTIRDREADVRRGLEVRGSAVDLDAILNLDRQRRALLAEVEALKNERNVVSKEIGQLKKAGQDAQAKQEAMRAVGEKIKALDEKVREAEAELGILLLTVPNIPHPTTPVGRDESANRFVREHGQRREFPFEPKPHWEIAAKLGLLDFECAARMTGAAWPLYKGLGARLERALIQFMLDLHTTEHGYLEVSPPFVVNSAAMTGTGQLPKLKDDMYRIPEDDLYLIPTAEVPVVNMFRESVIEAPLPVCLTAYTPCFRREAGAAGKMTRGLNRVHQFDKVEMIRIVEPDTSYDELATLVKHAEDVVQRLGLPYRVLELCTGDISFAAAKCFDIELWAPGQNAWLEVSSCSNCEDFQARRANIRYRTRDGKLAYPHILNGSGTALARMFVAVVENGQQADGSVLLPEALWPYMGGVQRIEAPRS